MVERFAVKTRYLLEAGDGTKGWDGSYKGVPQEIGSYHYLIRVAYPGSKVESYKGDVTLVK